MHDCTQLIACNQCDNQQTAKELLDRCFVSWPNKRWVAYQCSVCGVTNHLEVQNGSIASGFIDGFPGSCFIVKHRICLDQFSVNYPVEGIVIESSNLS